MENLIRLLRSQAGLSQQALAEIGGTSQPTIAQYEAGLKSPTITTLQKLAASLGLELVATYTPLMTREDRRSLAYHRAIAEKLKKDPSKIVKKARETLKRQKKGHPGAKKLFDRWQDWLNLPAEELIARILNPGMTARDMRQVTPFAGALKPEERLQILKEFRKEYAS